MRKPEVFLFDEPLSNLDAELRVQMRIEISKLHEQLGNTMIYVTHDQVEAMTMADKIVVLRDGQVEQMGSPLELYHKPCNQFVAGFIGSPKMNFLPVTVMLSQSGKLTLRLPDGQVVTQHCSTSSIHTGDQLTLGIRPEHFYSNEQGDVSVTIKAEVVERLGGTTYVHSKIAGHPVILEADGDAPIARRERKTFSFDLSRCHLFASNGKAITTKMQQDLPLAEALG